MSNALIHLLINTLHLLVIAGKVVLITRCEKIMTLQNRIKECLQTLLHYYSLFLEQNKRQHLSGGY